MKVFSKDREIIKMQKNIKTRRILIFLGLTLAACVPQQTNTVDVQGTLAAVIPTGVALTQTALSGDILPSSTFTPMVEMIVATPSPLPTEVAMAWITPDAAQMERWNEYETALTVAIFSYLPPEEVVCEWEILGRSGHDVYVWAYCAALYSRVPSMGSVPAVIHLETDGSVQSVEIPGDGTAYGTDIARLFPTQVQERIFGRFIALQELGDRLRWRRGHPDDPPLIVLRSLQIQPTEPFIPVVPPNFVQMNGWREYETALAKSFLSYLPPEQIICEWEILDQIDQEVYVWAICAETGAPGSLEGLAVVFITEEGSVINAETAGIGGMAMPADIQQMFPLSVQERYFGGLIHFQELVDHLRSRQGRAEEPPLIALSATPTP